MGVVRRALVVTVRAAATIVLVGACGRIGYDPTSTPFEVADGGRDGARAGDAAPILDAPFVAECVSSADCPSGRACLGGHCGLGGVYAWDRVFGAPGYVTPTGVALGPGGEVIVVGYFGAPTAGSGIDFGGGARDSLFTDAFVLALGADGTYLWDRVLGGTGSDEAHGVTVDSNGRIAVRGAFQNTVDFGGGPRVTSGFGAEFVVALGLDGSYMWDRTVSVRPISNVFGCIGELPGGGVVIAGIFAVPTDFGGGLRTSAGDDDSAVVALGPDGTYAWDRTLGGPGPDRIWGFTVSAAGEVTVSGEFVQPADFGGGLRAIAGASDIYVTTLDAGGNYVRDLTFGSSGDDLLPRVVATPAAELRVLGRFGADIDFGGGTRTTSGSVNGNPFVVALGAGGAYQWDRTFMATNSSPMAIAAGRGGEPVAVGTFSNVARFATDFDTSSAGGADAFVIALGVDGGYRWHRTFGGLGDDSALAVAKGAGGEIAVVGAHFGEVDFGGGVHPGDLGGGFVLLMRD